MWSGARNSEGEILGGLGERGERKGDFSRRGGIYKNVFFWEEETSVRMLMR